MNPMTPGKFFMLVIMAVLAGALVLSPVIGPKTTEPGAMAQTTPTPSELSVGYHPLSSGLLGACNGSYTIHDTEDDTVTVLVYNRTRTFKKSDLSVELTESGTARIHINAEGKPTIFISKNLTCLPAMRRGKTLAKSNGASYPSAPAKPKLGR